MSEESVATTPPPQPSPAGGEGDSETVLLCRFCGHLNEALEAGAPVRPVRRVLRAGGRGSGGGPPAFPADSPGLFTQPPGSRGSGDIAAAGLGVLDTVGVHRVAAGPAAAVNGHRRYCRGNAGRRLAAGRRRCNQRIRRRRPGAIRRRYAANAVGVRCGNAYRHSAGGGRQPRVSYRRRRQRRCAG